MSFVGDIIGGVGDIIGATKKNKQPQQEAFRGLITTPAFNFGGGVLTRRNQDFLQGQRNLRGRLQGLQGEVAGLRGQVAPGFSKLTRTGVDAIRQRAAESAGNLRANLARRGLLGASFASDAQSRVDQEFMRLEDEFRAQAFRDELAATQQLFEQQASLIDQEQNSLIAQAQQELAELGIATSFLQSVNQAAVTQADIAKQIAEEQLLAGYPSPEAIASGAVPPAAAPAPAGPAAPAPGGFASGMGPTGGKSAQYQANLESTNALRRPGGGFNRYAEARARGIPV